MTNLATMEPFGLLRVLRLLILVLLPVRNKRNGSILLLLLLLLLLFPEGPKNVTTAKLASPLD